MKFTILIEKTTQRKVIVDTDDEDSGRVAAVAGKGEAVNEGESRIKVLYAHPSSSEDVCNACQLAMPRHRCDACLDNPEREEPETEPTALGSLIDDKRHREDGMTLLSVHQKTGEQMTEHEMRLTVDQGWAAWDEFEMQGGGLYIHDEAKGGCRLLQVRRTPRDGEHLGR